MDQLGIMAKHKLCHSFMFYQLSDLYFLDDGVGLVLPCHNERLSFNTCN